MPADPRFDRYHWSGGSESMLRFGPAGDPTVIVAMPLFDEANRTRALAVRTLRFLAAHGIGGALPDLPGQGDSLIATRDARLSDWRAAFAAAVAALPPPVQVIALRGGSLIDGDAEVASRWHLSPLSGAAQMRELRRLQAMGEEESGFGGNDLSPALVSEIEDAEPTMTGLLRIVRLIGDPRPADTALTFPPPWRTAEPQRHDALAAALADDIAHWITSCAG